MDLQLKGKRALVTGSSGGIGKAIALVLAQEGAIVGIHGRNQEKADGVAREITEGGGKAFVAIGDLATDEGAKQVFDIAIAAVEGVDILINNAGEFHARGWMDTPPDAWASVYNTNVISIVRMIQLLVPQMKELRWGRIINISSVTGSQPFPRWPDYGASKAAVANLTVSLAKELKETGITVNSVSPGTTMSDGAMPFFDAAIGEASLNDSAKLEQQVLEKLLYNPTGQVGHVEDVADLCTFLASPRARFINGANLRIDGGGAVGVN
ncbi:MAG: SDR family NAD(P)-dependent oxidoreductase [Microcystaceae cyanobacterium]